MKIGVIGTGDVGDTLTDASLNHGHAVVRGTRNPTKLADWAKAADEKASGATPPWSGSREVKTFTDKRRLFSGQL